MRLVATTLTGNNEAIIEDALLSVVDWVDVCLVIDTNVTDRSLERARRVAGAKYVERKFTWNQDFSKARNFALDAASELGGDWAVTIDTDERLDSKGVDVRAALASATVNVFYVADAKQTYVKERFFRLPMSERWSGPTHESFAAYKVGCATLSGVTFDELGKSAEDRNAKFERDAEVLGRYTQEHPSDPRWHFYLGEARNSLGHLDAALAAYDRCSALRGWDEESAWACYRAAECLCKLHRYQDAVDRCALGLARHAGIAELAWLAGYASYQLERDAQAVYWAQLAISHGLFGGDGASIPRIGFREPAALWENPYDVLRWAERRRGNQSAAEEAERSYVEAIAAREKSRA